ncbi:MAG TPA: polysaccharide biosynthesis/export family protein [Terriglobales bacterium]|nr:polysaccharide biosynthesis/export family protein [Terriglobales bacterium]
MIDPGQCMARGAGGPGGRRQAAERTRRNIFRGVIPCVLALLWTMPAGLRAQGQNALAPPNPVQTPLPAPPVAMPDNVQPDLVAPAVPATYVIGANDLLSIFVYQMPEMTRQIRVSADGSIRLPFAAKSFLATGKTSIGLQQSIAQDLFAEGLVRQPIVQVTVVEVESKPVVIAGAVQRPVIVQAARPVRLLEALARAGGLSADAGDTVLVSSRDGEVGARATSQSYNLVQLMRYNNAADDPELVGNQTVTVLPGRKIYVVGDFNQPGAFPLSMGEPITVIRAIALARGLSASPDRSHDEIIETQADGTRIAVPISIDQIMKHKAPDLELHGGDVLYVSKDAKRQVLLAGLTDAAQLLTLGVAYHFP